jgi:hypothetical protein
MSERAREFLEHWKSDHVAAVTDGQRLQEAVRLVLMCRDDAICAGIPAHDLRAAAQNDMIRHMLAALDATARLKDDAQPEAQSPVPSRSRSRIAVAAHHLPPVALAILRRFSSAAA